MREHDREVPRVLFTHTPRTVTIIGYTHNNKARGLLIRIWAILFSQAVPLVPERMMADETEADREVDTSRV